MPEELNQLASDDHAHDANTKAANPPPPPDNGRLIKGIRKLTVIHNNFVPRRSAKLLKRPIMA
jgi:hypothetical protein